MIEIKRVKTKKDVRLFASYPVKLYKDCPYYVPSLRSDEMNTFNPKVNASIRENPFAGFLAYKDGELVGRVAAIISKEDNANTGVNAVRFSRFECIDDIEVFKALLGEVEKFGKERGMDIIHGPWGFTDQDREGMLTYGFDKRSTYATNYYYPYFCQRMQELGFEDESKWLEYDFTIPEVPYDRMDSLVDRIKKKYSLVDVSETMSVKKILTLYGDEFFETLNQSYGKLDGYVPVNGDVRKNILDQFATIINPKYISVLVDKNGHIAAFGIVLPSICNPLIKHKGKLFPLGFIGVLRSIKNPKELEMGLIGVRDEYKNTGVNSIIISRIMRNVVGDKIQRIESNPMLETNHSIHQMWKFAEYEIIKKRQTYKKKIGNLIK
ncbi:MAG: hypothetical protein II988_02725 [Clostridia bacterium]|nr:hypothetical protein [Clostridia bacterium]